MEVDQPQMFCSKLIQKQVDSEGMQWYSISQEEDIRAWLIEQDVWGCRTVQAPMPDKERAAGGYQSSDCNGAQMV